jgi:hypothetical protein
MAEALHHPDDQKRFIERLTQTVAWCTAAGSLSLPDTSLRTCRPNCQDLASQSHQVFAVAHQRWDRLRSIGRRDLIAVSDLRGGRLVAYFPDDNLSCGTAQHESRGFFDVDNIPPYDTWVWMVGNTRTYDRTDGSKGEHDANYLVAWVPPDFIQLAIEGIAVNPEKCIVWLDTLDDEFARSLRRLDLL